MNMKSKSKLIKNEMTIMGESACLCGFMYNYCK